MPKKKVLAGIGIAATAAVVFLLGSLGLMPVFAQPLPSTIEEQVGDQTELDEQETVEEGVDTDAIEEQVGDQTEIDDDADEAAGQGPDLDDVENQVEQDGEFDGEF